MIRSKTKSFSRFVLGISAALPLVLVGCASSVAPLRLSSVNLGENNSGEFCQAIRANRLQETDSPEAFQVYCGRWSQPVAQIWLSKDNGSLLPIKANLEARCINGTTKPDGRDCDGLAQTDAIESNVLLPGFFYNLKIREHYILVSGLKSARTVSARATRILAGIESVPVAATTTNEVGLSALEAITKRSGADGSLGAYQSNSDLGAEFNSRWRFREAEASFQAALAAHLIAAPADSAGRAELLGDLALNLSNQKRFQEAGDQLNAADRLAKEAIEEERRVLGTALRAKFIEAKLANYRVIDAANAGRSKEALSSSEQVGRQLLRLELEARQIPPSNFVQGAQPTLVEPSAKILIDKDLSRRLGAPTNLRDPFVLGTRLIGLHERILVLQAQNYHLRARLLNKLERPGAREALEAARLCLTNVPPSTAAWLRAVVSRELATLSLREGRLRDSILILDQAMNDYRKVASGTRLEALLLTSLADAKMANGDSKGALEAYDEGFGIYRAQLEQPGVSAEQAIAYTRALLDNSPTSTSKEAKAKAFSAMQAVVEPGVSEAVALMANRSVPGKGGEAIRRLQDADSRLSSAKIALARSVASSNVPPNNVLSLQADVKEAEKSRALAEGTVQEVFPEYSSLKTDTTIDDIQKTLSENEAFIQVVVGRSGGFLALVLKDDLIIQALNLKEAEATKIVQEVRDSLDPVALKTYELASARLLYKKLIEPVEGLLSTRGINRISYVLPSSLAGLPLAVLVTADPSVADLNAARDNQDYSSIKFAGQKYEFSQSVSASSHVSLHKLPASNATKPFVGFGGFVQATEVSEERINQILSESRLPRSCESNLRARYDNYEELPNTAAELRTAARILGANEADAIKLQGSFTDAWLSGNSDLSDFKVISFATHGLLAEDDCFTEPGLTTTLANDFGDGVLDLSEILELKLKADLVLLSACDTSAGGGLGPHQQEAFGGLVRGFFYAGTRSIIASQWRLADDAAPELTAFLFERMVAGDSVSTALARSQRQLMKDSQRAMSHPAKWGPLVTVGDGGRVLRL